MADSTDHSAWEERVQDWIDGDLSPSEAATIEKHAAACSACKARVAALKTVDAALAERLAAPALSPAFDRRVLARIERASSADRATLCARLERQWRADMDTFVRQGRAALGSTILNVLVATALLTAFLTRIRPSRSVAPLIDQMAQLGGYPFPRPGATLLVVALGASLLSLGLTRAFGER